MMKKGLLICLCLLLLAGCSGGGGTSSDVQSSSVPQGSIPAGIPLPSSSKPAELIDNSALSSDSSMLDTAMERLRQTINPEKSAAPPTQGELAYRYEGNAQQEGVDCFHISFGLKIGEDFYPSREFMVSVKGAVYERTGQDQYDKVADNQ